MPFSAALNGILILLMLLLSSIKRGLIPAISAGHPSVCGYASTLAYLPD
jgi:hypothetical protein